MSGDVTMGTRCPLQREENLAWIENRLAQRMWSQVAKHDANSGLWSGEAPLIDLTKKLHRKLLAEGRVQEAMALQAAVTQPQGQRSPGNQEYAAPNP